MSNRTKTIEKNLDVILPQEYKIFVDNIGIISDEGDEVFGYIENIDIEKIPCVIGATKLYKKDYKNISSKEIVISFDEYKNLPIVLNTESGHVYNVDFDEKTQVNSSFKKWLNEKIGESK